MNDRLLALRVFARVARLGSFSRAARELGLSQPSVSRIMAGLERAIGAALLTRTTRAVVPTEAGLDYLARIEPLLDALEEADLAARGTGELRGLLRIGVSSSFAVREVIPALPSFSDLHPELRVHLAVDDQYQNLIVEGLDVAFRFGALADSTATAQLLDTCPRLILASPDYLQRAGRPLMPGDLARHKLIAGPAVNQYGSWSFEKDGKKEGVRIDGPLSTTSNETAVTAAVMGMGIVLTLLWGCRKELEDKALVPLLTDWKTEAVELHAVFPAGRATKAAARAFVEHIRAHLQHSRKKAAGLSRQPSDQQISAN
jgi:DNA-binding transcriptional LysR family regulator